jgi:hypothetical protein
MLTHREKLGPTATSALLRFVAPDTAFGTLLTRPFRSEKGRGFEFQAYDAIKNSEGLIRAARIKLTHTEYAGPMWEFVVETILFTSEEWIRSIDGPATVEQARVKDELLQIDGEELMKALSTIMTTQFRLKPRWDAKYASLFEYGMQLGERRRASAITACKGRPGLHRLVSILYSGQTFSNLIRYSQAF